MTTVERFQKMDELIQQIKSIYPDTTTRIVITITASETSICDHHRYPDQLKKQNISMRNIKGDFIKDITTPA